MRPSERFELCGIEMKSSPAALCCSNHFQRPSGRSLSKLLNGRKRCAAAAFAGVNTTRCKFRPSGIEVHSQPTKLVNVPGWLCRSVIAVLSCQIERLISPLKSAIGTLSFTDFMNSWKTAVTSPFAFSASQRLPVSVAAS